jgi:hypothetical protein
MKQRGITLDDVSYQQGRLLADSKGMSVSGLIRMLLRDSYQQYEAAERNLSMFKFYEK